MVDYLLSFGFISTFLAIIGIYIAIKWYLAEAPSAAVFILTVACIGTLFMNYLNFSSRWSLKTDAVATIWTENVEALGEKVVQYKKEIDRSALLHAEKVSREAELELQRDMDFRRQEQRSYRSKR